MGEWSELPADLVRTIEEKLFFYQDKVKCRCISSSWRSALPKMPHQRRDLLPWLLVPLESKSRIGTCFGFFDPLDKKVHPLKLSDPQGKGMLFRGSSHGWVVNIDNNNSISLINPLTGAQVQLPPRSKFPDVKNYRPDKPGNEYGMQENDPTFYTLGEALVRNHFTEKVFSSSSPQSKDFVAVAIYGEFASLAYCKPGDKKWTFLGLGCYTDIVFHRRQMYALGVDGGVMVCDIHQPCPKLMELVSPPTAFSVTYKLHLVESSGGLLMLERNVTSEGQAKIDASKDIYGYKTYGFRIYKLDTSRREWHRVKDVGEDMLFIGWNSSLSMSCCNDFPGYAGNCIYFTDDAKIFHREGIVGGSDMGVFSLTDKSIQQLPGYASGSKLIWPPPVWFMPNFLN
ncbi:hypothetical protein PTKIN_Ptkin08bG0181300 [Pterospermum kingtungense]